MKFFGFRITTWLMFGLGFLLGSRAGNEPWQRVMEMWNEFRGEGGGTGTQSGDGQFKESARKAMNDVKETVTSTTR